MSSKEVGIETARKTLGDLVTAAQYGHTTIITRNGKPIARITPMEDTMTATYTAAVGTASDVVAGDFCDVSVAENDIVGYGIDDDETPNYSMGSKVVMSPVETDVRTDDEDKLAKVESAAGEVLEAHGWRVTGDWEIADNALYATVTRA